MFIAFPLDRWRFTSSSGEDRCFTNYLGFGVDAVVAKEFDNLRHKYPSLFHFQQLNIVWYTLCIIKEYLFPSMRKLTQLHVSVDNDEIDCSSYQLVLMLNIPFFCGGGNPIGVHFGYKQCCDKEIEVVGFTSIPHVILSKVRRIS